MTLLELTVVIAVLIVLAWLMLMGTQAWIRGSDRTVCIGNIHAVQKSVRGYTNMFGVNPGAVVPGLESEVVGNGKFFEAIPICPSRGDYTLGGNQVPDYGELYMSCSLGSTLDHVPVDYADW